MVILPHYIKGRPAPSPPPPDSVLKSFPSFCPQLILPRFIQFSTWKGTSVAGTSSSEKLPRPSKDQ